jgi:hypothetical protein
MGQGTNVIMLDSSPLTRQERMVAAGHDFIVQESEVFTVIDGENMLELGDWKAVRRSDGFHLNDMGAQILAVPVFAAVIRELESRGATNLTVPSTVLPTTIPSDTTPTT